MSPSADFASEEMNLAGLLCAKLRKVLRGTLSLGLTGCLTGIPEPEHFLAGQYEIIRAFALVLHHTTARPGTGSTIVALRQYTDRLLVLARDFHDTFQTLSRGGSSPAENQQVGARLVAIHQEMLEMLAGFVQEITGESGFVAQDRFEAQILVRQFLTALEASPQTT